MHRKIIPDLIENERPKRDGRVCELPVESTAFEAAQQMADCNVAAIAVTDEDGKLKGIVTERDLTRRVMGARLDPRETKLSQIMTRDPDTLRPNDSALDALKKMHLGRYRHMPVVTDGGIVVAMVSIRHLYAAIQLDLEDDVQEYRSFVFDTGYGARQ
ncbi:MAG: CBS domain-containing protein [Rhodospirillales bacterium]|nr:CBS domain-containing protein [Rhodospirillales bacterium]